MIYVATYGTATEGKPLPGLLLGNKLMQLIKASNYYGRDIIKEDEGS